MAIRMIIYKLALLSIAVSFQGLVVAETVSGQTEKLGAIQYTAPKGWNKTSKENTVVFSEFVQATGRFCTITLYGATPGTGEARRDFVREWNDLVVKPFGGEPNPKTETDTADGWTAIAAGSPVDFGGGKALAFLTVFSRADTTVSVLGIFNDESYLSKLDAFTSGLDIELPKPIAQTAAPPARDENGHLIIPVPTRQLTIADLAGEWGQNDGINTRYVYRDSGVYAGADSLHFTSKMTLTAQGGSYNDFFAIENGRRIKEDTKGTFFVRDRVLYIRECNLRKFIIRGWLELPDMTILEICGPWYDDDPIPEDHFADPTRGANLNKRWVRRK